MKPGWQTTEFWLSLVAVAAGAIVSSGAFQDNSPWMRIAGLVVSVLGALGYTAARGKLKSETASLVGNIASSLGGLWSGSGVGLSLDANARISRALSAFGQAQAAYSKAWETRALVGLRYTW
jgi:hypothetical protein